MSAIGRHLPAHAHAGSERMGTILIEDAALVAEIQRHAVRTEAAIALVRLSRFSKRARYSALHEAAA